MYRLWDVKSAIIVPTRRHAFRYSLHEETKRDECIDTRVGGTLFAIKKITAPRKTPVVYCPPPTLFVLSAGDLYAYRLLGSDATGRWSSQCSGQEPRNRSMHSASLVGGVHVPPHYCPTTSRSRFGYCLGHPSTSSD